MKRVSIALVLICLFLTSCSKDKTDVPTDEPKVITESVVTQALTSTTKNISSEETKVETDDTISESLTSTTSDLEIEELTIIGIWEDSLAEKQRTQGVSDEEFSNFTDEEREQYFEEFGTVPGITLEFKSDGTFSGNMSSDSINGKYELKFDETYNMIFTEHENIWTAVVNGDSMIFSVDIPELKRITS